MTAPLFERRHYIAIARILWELRDVLTDEQMDATMRKFIDLFANDNPNFDPGRFWDAVYKEQKPEEI